jgi:hypothetical protein
VWRTCNTLEVPLGNEVVTPFVIFCNRNDLSAVGVALKNR